MATADNPPRRNWWSRNWKWCVPALCIAGIGAFVGVILLFAMFVMNMLRSSTPYQEAMQRVRASPAVVAALGTPIEAGWLFSGHIETSRDTGSADIVIPVHGPKGEATLRVEATRPGGTWRYREMSVTVPTTHQRIDLLRATEKVRYDNPDMFQARARTSNATYAYTPAITSSSITPSPP